MAIKRSHLVKSHHFKRKAVVYRRVSSPKQARESEWSQAAQEDQRFFAVELGWTEDMIEVADELGKDGKSMVHRKTILQTIEEIKAKLVGGLFASDLSRIGRNAAETLNLLLECKRNDVAAVENGNVLDQDSLDGRVEILIKVMMAELENISRMGHIRRALKAKLDRGYELTPPPPGYVRDKYKKKWIKDPDSRVREGIEAVFRIFAEENTAPRTARRLHELGIKVPVRKRRPIEEAGCDE
jgi:DNA invertase Pin-like site-specific DNA recombinase